MTRKFIWAMVWVVSAPAITWPKEKADPTATILADFNNDGKLDLAVNGPDEGVILIYLGNGKGGFRLPPAELEDLRHCDGFTAADFNGDGNQDLGVVTHGQQGNAHIFLGDGTGNFNTAPSSPSTKMRKLWRLAT